MIVPEHCAYNKVGVVGSFEFVPRNNPRNYVNRLPARVLSQAGSMRSCKQARIGSHKPYFTFLSDGRRSRPQVINAPVRPFSCSLLLLDLSNLILQVLFHCKRDIKVCGLGTLWSFPKPPRLRRGHRGSSERTPETMLIQFSTQVRLLRHRYR